MKRATARWLVLGIILGLLGGCSACDEDCPQIYRIKGETDATKSYNILFVSAGFKRSELPAFRKAARDYADILLEKPPYDQFAQGVNFYRMDLTSKDIQSKCPDELNCAGDNLSAVVPTSSIPLGDPVYPPDEREPSADVDLKVTRCWRPIFGQPDCRMLWLGTNRQAKLFELSFCAPNISAVVVIADIDRVAGGGRGDAFSSGVGLAVIGVPHEGTTPPPGDGFTINEKGHFLLAHEVSHALGLHDEYKGPASLPKVPYRPGRNIFKPGRVDGVIWTPDMDTGAIVDLFAASASVPCPPIPWGPSFDCTDGLVKCCDGDPPGMKECPWVLPAADGCGCVIQGYGKHGLWEGAFYKKRGYYRARHSCLMSTKVAGTPFCEGCETALSRVLCEYTEADDCPPPIPDPPANCEP